MEEELITFDTAVLAREKGFKVPTFAFYTKSGELFWLNVEENPPLTNNSIEYIAPTQSLLQKWLREVHLTHIYMDMTGSERFTLCFRHIDGEGKHWSHTYKEEGGYVYFDTYEEALEKGLQEALKLIKNEKVSTN